MPVDPELVAIQALSPLDGRYAHETQPLREYFSEFALVRGRVRVEVEYLLALSREARLIRPLTHEEESILYDLVANFTPEAALRVKAIERTTRHDVKAVEYYLRERLTSTSLVDVLGWLHWGLTSEDVNLIALALALRDSRDRVLLPAFDALIGRLADLAKECKSMPMLARTHGQAAVPTTLGKEFAVFVARLKKQRAALQMHGFEAKLNGAVGNLNALVGAAPQVDWLDLTLRFVRSFGLEPNPVTTQLIPYDNWIRYFQVLHLVNSVLLDLAQDTWRYISDDYLVLRVVATEVGSSTMPQKVNPIDFENAEGNLGLSNALLSHYADKLPVSRLQRDLSDSTVRRTFGVALGHALLAYTSLTRGLARVQANEEKLRADLESHWAVVAEGAQMILRTAGLGDAYETLKELTRGKSLTRASYNNWVETLAVSADIRAQLHALSPFTYLGLAEQLVDRALEEESG